MRSLAIALARSLNAAFFLGTSAYCLLAYSPFAYQQFLKPQVIPWLADAVAIHPALYWLVLLVTALTLMPQLKWIETPRDPGAAQLAPERWRSRLGRSLARAYVIAGALLGAALIVSPLMPTIGNTRRSFIVALLALMPPLWLAAVDHLDAPPPLLEPSRQRHLLKVCALAAASVWLTYAAGAPFRLARISGVELSPVNLIAGAAQSAVAHAFVFMGIFLVLAAVAGAARTSRGSGPVEYWLLAGSTAAAIALVVRGLVFTSVAFTGFEAASAAAAVGATIALVWSGVVRKVVRENVRPTAVPGSAAPESPGPTALRVWLAPVGIQSRTISALTFALLPVAAYALVTATAGLDWNFVIQKLGVLMVWVVAFAAAHAMVGRDPGRADSRLRRGFGAQGYFAAVPPCVALALFQVVAPLDARAGLSDRYAAVDVSFRLVRDLRTARGGETADFYAFLKANTLVVPPRATSSGVQLAGGMKAAADPPDIFLFVIDSLRRDYVSPYNPAVTFTPAIARFASGSFVFERAFTRYSGTGMAVPSIWAGSLLLHAIDQRPFDGRNALLKLLDADGYRRVIGIDTVMRDLLPPGSAAVGDAVELDRGVPSMETDFCRTERELQAALEAPAGDSRPVFSYTLPQNVHIAVAPKQVVPPGHVYPGFLAPVAESVRRVDECFGELIAFLQRSGRYDRSIVVLTSDHGDSLGEEGRWGHAYFMVPEVMRVPLIVHVPAALRDRVHADLNRVSFSTDIVPTLYALLGHQPSDPGPSVGTLGAPFETSSGASFETLFGAPLLVGRDRDLAPRRSNAFLLASSYGAVYGMLGHNGRRLYTADAIDGRDDAYDLSGIAGRRVAITGAMTALNRRLMTEQLRQLASLNHFVPQP